MSFSKKAPQLFNLERLQLESVTAGHLSIIMVSFKFNILNLNFYFLGLDPFAEMLTVSFDVAQASSSCDLAWAGEKKEFVSRCRVADDNIDRPVEAIFLLDTSTSMFGRKSQQAAKIISLMQANLRPTDRFNVARFDRELEFLDEEDLVANTKENRERALDFMIKSADGGGTDIYTAIVQVLNSL